MNCCKPTVRKQRTLWLPAFCAAERGMLLDSIASGCPIWSVNDHTPPDDDEMMYVKETVFGVKGGKPNNLWE
jgi:hypothetical protein